MLSPVKGQNNWGIECLEDKPASALRFFYPVEWACVFTRVGTDVHEDS